MQPDDDSTRARSLSLDILERYRQVYRASRNAEPLLRYGRRTIAVSTIAQQFYCEKAVQFSIERPLAPTQSMRDGVAGHEAVSSLGVTMTQQEAIEAAVVAREVPVCVYEFRIGWHHHSGATILGFVDEAWFRNAHVDLVAERKFSSNPAIHAPYHVQAGLYCLGLGEMGFGTECSRYRISVFSRQCHDCASLASGECPTVAIGADSHTCDRGASISRTFPFERDSVHHDLEWALEFWTGKREAQATTNPSRCRACRYQRMCNRTQT